MPVARLQRATARQAALDGTDIERDEVFVGVALNGCEPEAIHVSPVARDEALADVAAALIDCGQRRARPSHCMEGERFAAFRRAKPLVRVHLDT